MSRVTETADFRDSDLQACLDTDVTSIACAGKEMACLGVSGDGDDVEAASGKVCEL